MIWFETLGDVRFPAVFHILAVGEFPSYSEISRLFHTLCLQLYMCVYYYYYYCYCCFLLRGSGIRCVVRQRFIVLFNRNRRDYRLQLDGHVEANVISCHIKCEFLFSTCFLLKGGDSSFLRVFFMYFHICCSLSLRQTENVETGIIFVICSWISAVFSPQACFFYL